jgi:hypothetical protein
MTGLSIAVANFAFVLVALGLVWRVCREVLHASNRVFGVAWFLGLSVAAACLVAERAFFGWIGVHADAPPAVTDEFTSGSDGLTAGLGGALLAMLLFAAPLEEGSKVLAIWPLHTRDKLITRADSVFSALCAAGGFAVWEGTVGALHLQQRFLLARVLLLSVGHLFFAGVWAFVLGDSLKRRRLRVTWMAATLFHGLFDHLVLVRGEGTLAVLIPVVGSMAVVAFWAIQSVAALPRALQWFVPAHRQLQGAFARPPEGVKVRWIGMGALVTTGVALVALVVAVIIGHRIGIDFAAADEGDVRANGPLVLLGASVTSGFPIAGYLVAKGSGTRTLLEPAFGAGFSLTGLVLALAFAAPVTLVFALPIMPVAIALTCVGAWFGLAR